MTIRKYTWVGVVLVAAVAVAYGFRSPQKDRLPPLVPPPPPPAVPLVPFVPIAAQPKVGDGAETGIKASTAEYQKAFNAADAKTAAALWTAEGEYIDADGTVTTGREAIEKSLAEFFKAHPKATADIQVEKIRVLGRGTASAEGVVRLKTPGEDVVIESHYTALHVLEDGKWHAASVREWVPDPATAVKLGNLDWIIGEWSAKGDAGEVKLTYKWDENKVFISGYYELLKDGKRVSYGTQIIGRNPTGGLRSWSFDSNGTTTESIWVRDDTRWISETTGMLPDGSEMSSLNIFIRVSDDAFTWQTTDRAVNGVPLPALPPIKVTRVKK
jgi:uncharacterized protein (TIGR02246 family)